MYRFFENFFFSIFLIFVFIKFSLSTFSDSQSQLITYFYYAILFMFIFYEFFKKSEIRLNSTEIFLIFSILWCCAIAFINAEPNIFFYKKLNSLIISILTIPIAYHIFYRDLMSLMIYVTSICLFIIAILFNTLGTFNEVDPAYILNNFYLHASFLCGFVVFLIIVLKKHYILIPPLIIAIIIFGSRGPFVAFLLTGFFITIFYFIKFLSFPLIKTKYLKYILIYIPGIFVPVFLFLPNLFFRMVKRWEVFLYQDGGGDSVSRRLEHYDNAINIITNETFLGIGFGNYGKYIDGFHSNSYPHNIFLELLVENGLIGALPFLLCLFLILLQGILNKSWPVLLFVLLSMQFSYSYAELNELYFALVFTLAISKTSYNKLKEAKIENY